MNWAKKQQRVVVCEGFDDRDFWKGWLTQRLGCSVPPGGQVQDPFGFAVTKGKHGYATPGGDYLLVEHAHGDRSRVRKAAADHLKRPDRPTTHLVLNFDSDAEEAGTQSADDSLDQFAGEHGYTRDARVPRRYTKVADVLMGVVWASGDAKQPGVPDQQCLERIVCSAIVAAQPDTAQAVEAWLAARPERFGDHDLARSHKRLMASYYAKWFSHWGHGHFLEGIWKDSAIAAELERQLGASGAWALAEELVGMSRKNGPNGQNC